MKLRYDSINARLYRWFYSKETSEMPSNLCPYFWKSAIMWILLPLFSIILLPTILTKSTEELSVRFAASILIYLMLFLIFLMLFCPVSFIIWGYIGGNSIYSSWQIGGLMVWLMAILAFIWYSISTFIKKMKIKRMRINEEFIWTPDGDRIPNPHYSAEKQRDNIILEFIKAKYNKNCPKIDWEK